jgi:hypothetical protein
VPETAGVSSFSDYFAVQAPTRTSWLVLIEKISHSRFVRSSAVALEDSPADRSPRITLGVLAEHRAATELLTRFYGQFSWWVVSVFHRLIVSENSYPFMPSSFGFVGL